MATLKSTSKKQGVIENLYRDSVSLMQLSSRLNAMDGVVQASVVVASESNLELLRDSKLIEGAVDAGPSDVLIVIEGTGERLVANALAQAKSWLLEERAPLREGHTEQPPTSVAAAFKVEEDSNIVLIATPGEYAASEALKALKSGLNVMLFSDGVPAVDEVRLKQYGRDHGLLVMGPDCGTAIINGVPLGFANVVRRGSIGVIAASGTGLQQVTSLIDRYGAGVSQAIGTGGHDLQELVGGITMLQSLDALQEDSSTEIIVLVSKPPSAAVAAKIIEAAGKSAKPVVINFLRPGAKEERDGMIQFVRTLEDAARAAVDIAVGGQFTAVKGLGGEVPPELSRGKGVLGSGGYVRGLFSGGTFCYEALILLSESVGPVYSNVPIDGEYGLDDAWVSRDHCLVDLGDDEFTRGRPHPMIDHRLRNERIVKEAEDANTAVILLDIVLGYGSHLDPASEMAGALAAARSAAGERDLLIIGSVCGTEADPQNLRDQEQSLENLGVLLAGSNAQAARWAGVAVGGTT